MSCPMARVSCLLLVIPAKDQEKNSLQAVLARLDTKHSI